MPVLDEAVHDTLCERDAAVCDGTRFIVEAFSKLECEVLNDGFRSDQPADLMRWADDLASLVSDRLCCALRIEGPRA